MIYLQPKNTGVELELAAPLIPLAQGTAKHFATERTLQLIYALHSSLDIKNIIQQFSKSINQELNCNGINYRNHQLNIAINIGEMSHHKVSYHLNPTGTSLGDIIFSRDKAFTDNEVLKIESFLCFLLNPLNNAIEHLQALHSALHDPLTGLSNRATLETTLHRDIEFAKRYKSDFSLLALDLDHFKKVNDTYGHAGGDSLLKRFAIHLQSSVRESDMVFRSGGEEFIILLSKTDTKGAIKLADKICKSTGKIKCPHKDQLISITVSIGVASYVSGDNEISILEKADTALYRAKNEGRNRVAI